MKKIDIGISVDMQKLVDTRLLLQAGSGGGKSYALRKIIESVGEEVQQLIIDPEGEFVSLREKFPLALVAKDGDIPLSLKYAETLAHKLLETGLSAIIDLYELKHHERILFVKRFLDALVNAPKSLWHPCLIYVDEAHIFCPESSKSESMTSVIDLCTRGRKRGFAAVLATQRLSKLHKDAAAECMNKMIGSTGLDIDRKRAGEELGFVSKQDVLNLRELKPGEFYAFGPAISNEVKRFKVAPVITSHMQNGSRITTAPPTPKAIEKILEKLKDIPEEAARELETKQQLQQEITRLRTQLSKIERTAPESNDGTLKRKIETLKEREAKYSKIVNGQLALMKSWEQEIFVVNQKIKKYIGEFQDIADDRYEDERVQKEIPKVQAPINKPPEQSSGSLPKGDEIVLQILAMLHPQPVTRRKTAILSRYSPTKSTFRNILSRLRQGGYITDIDSGTLAITEVGLATVGVIDPIPVDGDSLISFWKGELGSGPFALLKYLYDAKQYVSRDQLAEGTGYDIGKSTFRNMLSNIRSLGLIEENKNQVKIASDFLN